MDYAPGSIVIARSDATVMAHPTLSKVKEIAVVRAGTLRLSWEWQSNYNAPAYQTNGSVFVFVNGVQVAGPFQTNGTTFVPQSHDCAVQPNDLVQLYAVAGSGSGSVMYPQLRNFHLGNAFYINETVNL